MSAGMAQQGPFAAGLAQVPGVAPFVVPAGAIHVNAPVTGDGTVATPLGVSLGNGLTLSAGALVASLGQGLGFVGGAITPALGAGLSFDGGNNLQDNLLVGLAGGQLVKGGANASDGLTLTSTAHATKGTITLGSPTAELTVNESNHQVTITGNSVLVGTGARVAGYAVSLIDASFGNLCWGTATVQGQLSYSGSGPLFGSITNHQTGIVTNAVTRCFVPAPGGLVVGTAAIAAAATDGFLYLPTCAGAPSGVPTTRTGTVAIVYDTTNHKLWIYDTAWKGGTNPGVWT